MTKKSPKDRIGKIIENHPEGLTIQKVADLASMSRLTATKYIHELIGEGRIYERRVGAARILYSKERFMKLVKEEEIIQKIKEKMK
jgi:response regulator of citrate/malate metabolism